MSIGGSLIRCEPGMTRSGPLSGVKAVIHHMAEVGIPPADVGQRVTIRWCPAELEGSSEWMTDVLGILEEADDQFFKVRRGRDGQLVVIRRERALAGKVVPPAPPPRRPRKAPNPPDTTPSP